MTTTLLRDTKGEMHEAWVMRPLTSSGEGCDGCSLNHLGNRGTKQFLCGHQPDCDRVVFVLEQDLPNYMARRLT